MTLEQRLAARSGNQCELCQATGKLTVYEVPPQTGGYEENNILICAKCQAQIEKKEELDSAHWNVLTTAMWSEVPGVQVVAWRLLNDHRAGLEMLRIALSDRGSAWHDVVLALVATLPELRARTRRRSRRSSPRARRRRRSASTPSRTPWTPGSTPARATPWSSAPPSR